MASEQNQAVQQNLERFFHHDKTEHPPTDTEMGKTPARDSGTRQAEHKEKRREENQQNPLTKPVERRRKDALKQADEYGREMNVSQTKPQTLLDDQDQFGASSTTDEKESKPKVSLFGASSTTDEKESKPEVSLF